MEAEKVLDLKCEPWELTRPYMQWRVYNAIKFLELENLNGLDVLDIGDANDFGVHLASYFGMNYHHTSGNLDGVNYNGYYSWVDSRVKDKPYPMIFCCEVLEHLINPLLFLEMLKRHINHETKIFISYPHHALDFLWGDMHFHEFRDEAFKTLLDMAGYKIIAHQEYKLGYGNSWRFYFTGIRPLLRLLVVLFGWSKHHLYLVKLKD
jgi:hypothetical protein